MNFEFGITKKYTYKGNHVAAQAASIARRNARERNRVKQVNDGFNALRKRLPAAVINELSGGARRGSGKKLSKVDTLRMVVEYIRYLERLVDESDAALGMTNTTVKAESCMGNENFPGRMSDYCISVPSPANSESSSGISSLSSSHDYLNYQQSENMCMVEHELFDVMW